MAERSALCRNCSAVLVGEYCSICGQRGIQPDDLSARRYLRVLGGQISDSYLQFKTLRSLRALFTPGRLTREFVAGRRQPYLSPVKIYFVCAAIFFVAVPFVGLNATSMIERDPGGKLNAMVAERMAQSELGPAHFAARFDVRLKTIYTVAMGLAVIAGALALQLMYRRPPRPVGIHLVFAIHFGAFTYFVTLLGAAAI